MPLSPRHVLALLAAWLVCAVLVLAHARATQNYLRFLESAAARPAPPSDPAASLPHLLPGAHADAQSWARHALAVGENSTWRIRHTDADNAPAGRPVHWSSLFTWLVAGAGVLRGLVTGEPRALALDAVLPWFNAPLLLAALALLLPWIARRFGTACAVLAAFALVGHGPLAATFAPANVDHHGLLALTTLGLLLGFAVGCQAVSTDRRALFASALCGAVGLWLSAATTLPVTALTLATLLFLAFRSPLPLATAGLRFWSRTGAALAALFYLIEYFPAHLGWRLEVNHPLHTAAWWGGGELVALVAGWRASRKRPPVLPLACATLAVVSPLLTIAALGPDATFRLGDPFIGTLRHFVAEGQSFFAVAARVDLAALLPHLASTLVLAAAAIAQFRRPPVVDEASRLVSFALLFPALALTTLAFAEIRWWPTASVALLALLLVLLASAPARLRRIAVATLSAVFLLAATHRLRETRALPATAIVPPRDLAQVHYRDLAAFLLREAPATPPVILSDPNASLALAYYARARTLGTLYWENTAGLRAAAGILCATDDTRAAELVRARGVTHVVSVAGDTFVPEFLQLLRPADYPARLSATLGHRLAHSPATAPAWLQPLPYRPPAALGLDPKTIAVFKVDFAQPAPDRLLHLALFHAVRAEPAAADAALAQLLALAPAAQHPALHAEFAARCYDHGADALAAHHFRRALALAPDDATANTLAWLLATTSDDSLRDPAAALTLIQPVVARAPADPAVLSTHAAALAALHRFPAAIRSAELALAANRDPAATPLLEKRLASYRASQPWQQ